MKYLLAAMLTLGAAQLHADESNTTRAEAPEVTTEATGPQLIHITPSVSYSGMTIKGDSIPWKADNGVSLGVFAELGQGFLTGQTGLLYSDYNSRATSADIRATAKLSYLSLPLMAKMNFSGNVNHTVYVKAGLQPSTLVAHTVSAFGPVVSGSNALLVKKFDIPVVGGVGISYPIGTEKSLTAEADYVRSLTNINNSSTSTAKLRNEGFVINAGLSIGI